MKPLLLLIALAAVPVSDSRREAFRRCVDCRTECRRSADRKECVLSCYRAKAADCRRGGHGPGPSNTCDCT